MKIRLVGAEFFRADGRADGETETTQLTNSRFSLLYDSVLIRSEYFNSLSWKNENMSSSIKAFNRYRPK